LRQVIDAIAGEYRRYRILAENAVAQLSDAELHVKSGEGNSVATLMQHLGGNLASRFTDFLVSDGEKPWRNRDAEFEEKAAARAELLAGWEQGWSVLFSTLESLSDDDFARKVAIRGVELSVIEALTRSLSHAAYHAGQIVLIAKTIRGAEWRYLSIPPKGSGAYNAHPELEKPPR
jgi:hypothetical protein